MAPSLLTGSTSLPDLLLFIRGLEDTPLLQQHPGKLVLPVGSDGAADEVSALRQELAEIKVMIMQHKETRVITEVRNNAATSQTTKNSTANSQQPNNQQQVYTDESYFKW